MLTMFNLLLANLLFSSTTQAQAQEAACKPLRWNISASALNLDLSPWTVDTLLSTPLATLLGNVSELNFNAGVNVHSEIYGVYCEPLQKVDLATKSTLQILVHGSSYTSDYWRGSDSGDSVSAHSLDYDWVHYANSRGYPTIAIDRLGNGQSSHPDPKVVQYTLEVEILHQLSKNIRAAFPHVKNLVCVGNAYGSILGSVLAEKYPADFEAIVLTGYSKSYNTEAFGNNLIASYVSPGANLDEGYTQFLNISIFQQLLYAPFYTNNAPYSPAVLNDDFIHRGTISVGEIATAYFGIREAAAYKGHILVATGQDDIVFCGNGPLG
ncbi:hypothetical protein HYALB_00005380 [Hymenoscyphus albidus]|uniref:AB hydrolase-1 domain-containing protein n=1 Tax=Hymenoscyphus albidus TaxID=595503 RepID=A0A9N9LHB9_9HELO|nr:hypothetical protein HYALB_00005380 [Hymenoscyphus albidus]